MGTASVARSSVLAGMGWMAKTERPVAGEVLMEKSGDSGGEALQIEDGLVSVYGLAVGSGADEMSGGWSIVFERALGYWSRYIDTEFDLICTVS
jgi:hypothetical protein